MAVVTISRQYGAGGKTLGKMIADKLGYTFAESDVIQMIAEKANVSPAWVESIEKESGTTFGRVVSHLVSRGLVDKILKDERGYMDEKIYLDYLVVIISQIAEEGNVVVLGRGSQYILNDHPDAYHILLINEDENRVKFLMDQYDLSKNQAVQKIQSEDKRRLNMYKRLGKQDYDDAELYHLVLNMGRMSLEKALRIVLDLVKEE